MQVHNLFLSIVGFSSSPDPEPGDRPGQSRGVVQCKKGKRQALLTRIGLGKAAAGGHFR